MDDISALNHMEYLWKEAKETGDRDCLWRRQLGVWRREAGRRVTFHYVSLYLLNCVLGIPRTYSQIKFLKNSIRSVGLL